MAIEDSLLVNGRGSTRQPSKIEHILTKEEYDQVRTIFIEQFDILINSYKREGDKIEITEYLSTIYSEFRLFKSFTKQFVMHINSETFRKEVAREFMLELLSRFSINVTSIGNDAFERLINTIALGASTCRAKSPQNTPELIPILESVSASSEQIRTVYLDNPWLVICAMISMEFSRTVTGQGISSE